MAFNTPRLKLRAYQALNRVTQLHDHELCLLLGETFIKDSRDNDPTIRMAALNASLSNVTASWGEQREECRGSIIEPLIRNDKCPCVRLRALSGLLAIAEEVDKDEIADRRAESARKLLDIYRHA